MKNQLLTVTEVVVRSAFYIITNYVFVSMGLSFHTLDFNSIFAFNGMVYY